MSDTPAVPEQSEPLSIDPEDLTLREVIELEDIIGCGIDVAFTEGSPKGKAIAALVYLTKKRQDPKLKFDDVLDMNLHAVDLGGSDAPGED